MSTSKHIDKICCAVLALSLLLTVLFMNGKALGLEASPRELGYESRLFSTQRVHTIDIVIDDWEGFLDTCENEEYAPCAVIIDGEAYQNVGLRAKGNTSLSSVSQMGSDRYSFKIEFDHYESGKSCHGLDKLCLNNLIQDNTCMKDYLTYQLMAQFGVDGPLCSYAYLTVNGEDWGLYLAVEGIEDSFLRRTYGSDPGELYKPDSTGFGGGRGNGREFDMDSFMDRQDNPDQHMERPADEKQPPSDGRQMPPDGDGGGISPPSTPDGGGFGGNGSSDVKLQYIDDDPDSYANIFSNAKTDPSQAGQQRLISSLKSLSAYENLEAVLDTEEVLRYFVVHNFVVNGDSYTGGMIHNYYLHEKDGQLSMIPWDYNLAFGAFQSSSADSAVNDPIDEVLDDRPMQAWIFSDEAYTAQYHALFAEFLNRVDIDELIDSAYILIAPYVEQDPTKFCTFEEFETGVQALKAFCALRTQSVQGQLDGTIPSTQAGQSADPSALVDASGIQLSDMGSMDTGGGAPHDGFESGGNPPGFSQQTPEQPPNGDNPPEGIEPSQQPQDSETPPEGFDPPEGSGPPPGQS